ADAQPVRSGSAARWWRTARAKTSAMIAEAPVAQVVVQKIDATHPVAVEWMNRYLAKHGLHVDAQPPHKQWFLIARGDKPLVVFSYVVYANGAIEGTDFYMEPTREGFKAALDVLEYGKHLVDTKKIPFLVTTSFYKNDRFVR